MKNKKIAVIGSGSWATAITKILLNNVDSLSWWIREEEIIENIKKHGRNKLFLSSVELDSSRLMLTSNLQQAWASADIIVLCVPSAFLCYALNGLDKNAFEGKYIVSAVKGIIPEKNLVVEDYLKQEFAMLDNNFAVVSGPSHAEEVAQEKMTYLTVASQNSEFKGFLTELFKCRYIKTIASEDTYGIEYSSVLKNIVSIASGICNRLGLGDNFQAVLVANAIKEIQRFVDAVHPVERDITNSVYLGDLMVTAYSQFSRNRMFGVMIGKGYSVNVAQLEMKMIAEGYYAVKGIHEINKKHQVEMPITNAVYNILYEGISPLMEMRILADKLS